MDVRDYLAIARARWRIISVITLLGIAMAATMTLLTKPVFQSQTSVLFSVRGAMTPSELAQGSSYAESQVESFAEVATSPLVLTPVIQQLQLRTTPGELSERVTVTIPNSTVILAIAVEASNPKEAADTANAIAAELSTVAAGFSPKSDGQETVKATVISPAQPASAPIQPRPLRNLAAGLLMGIVAGFGAALLADRIDTRVKAKEDVEAITQTPILGVVPFDDAVDDSGGLSAVENQGIRHEAYRKLRTNLQFVSAARGNRVLVVTSSVMGEGKSLTMVGLAFGLADTGKTVLLIDADMRRPRLAHRLGLEGNVGLSSVLSGAADLADVAQPWGQTGLSVVTSGLTPPNPTELLDSEAMTELVNRAAEEFDVVLIDAPPLLPVADALVLGKQVGGVLVVVGMHDVKKPQLADALDSLAGLDVRVQGLVLNKVRLDGDRGLYRGYYSEEADAKRSKKKQGKQSR